MCMSVAEESIRKSTGIVNNLMEFWECTDSPRYYTDRFHIYWNCPNNMDPDVVDRMKRPIQEYARRNSAMGGSKGYQGIQYGRGQTYSTTTRSMFAECRAQLSQLWNEKVFSSLYQALLMREMVDTSISRYSLVHFAAAKKAKLQRKPQDRL